MSGGYVPPYGFDPYGNGSSQQGAHQQQQQGHQSLVQQNNQQHVNGGPSCFEGYNPAIAAPAPQQYVYSPTVAAAAVPTPAAFMPPFMPAVMGDPALALQNHHQRLSNNEMSPSKKQKNNRASSSSAKQVPAKTHSSSRSPLATPLMTFSTIFDSQLEPIGSSVPSTTLADPAKPASDDSWLDTIQIHVSGVALEPLSGKDILQRVRRQTDNVVTCYLPCVEFLVNCQQELRAGLATATQKKLVRHAYRDNLSPKQFYNRYLGPLVDRFHRRNKHLMEANVLADATKGVSKLCTDAQKVQSQGCEAMKNAFLGGMKDGESWGLRKWLSKNGGALHICNDLECILHACQKLDRSQETTLKLSERLRPLAKQALGRLKSDVPPSYQEVSTAHPYLPFFHRLESALKGMADFDPEDDDVICIDDDDEIEEVKAKAANKKQPAEKRPASIMTTAAAVDTTVTTTAAAMNDYSIEPYAKRQKKDFEPVQYDFGRDGTPPIKNPFDSDGDDDSIIEIIGVKQANGGSDNSSVVNAAMNSTDNWRCSRCSMLNAVYSNRCCMCSKKREGEVSCSVQDTDNEVFDAFNDLAGLSSFDDAAASVASKIFDLPNPSTAAAAAADASARQSFAPPAPPTSTVTMTANEMTQHLERLAYLFDINKQDSVRPNSIESDGFWDTSGDRYARILRLFASLIRNRDSQLYLYPIDPQQLNASGRAYSSVIKHPVCFQNIVHSLVDMDHEESHTKSDDSDRPCGSGVLSETPGLTTRWNMWRGFDLLQAIDLVFLNALAFNGKERTAERSQTNRLRKQLWDEIHSITSAHFVGPHSDDEKRRVTPTRRGENSGFVIHKV